MKFYSFLSSCRIYYSDQDVCYICRVDCFLGSCVPFSSEQEKYGKDNSSQNSLGAVFTACGWLLLSFFFSVYLDVFKGFTSMYGSLTTITLIMLWLYGCMYIILLGGEINALLEKFLQKRAGNLKKKKEKEV